MKIARELLIIATLIISPPTYSEKGEVCFYELDDFRGESFCSNEGEKNPLTMMVLIIR